MAIDKLKGLLLLKKKGKYLLILLIIFAIWHYKNKKEQERYFIEQKVTVLIDSIRVQDYYTISTLLDKNVSNKTPIENIHEFSQKFNLAREFKITLKDYNESELVGTFKDSSEHNFTLNIKEHNNSFNFTKIKIDNIRLKQDKYGFPIVNTNIASPAK